MNLGNNQDPVHRERTNTANCFYQKPRIVLKEENKVIVWMKHFEEINHVIKLERYMAIIPITFPGDAWFKFSYKGSYLRGYLYIQPKNPISVSLY